MTEEQISQWAREAGIYLDGANQQTPMYVATKKELQAFATVVRNATLEEAALKIEKSYMAVSQTEQNLNVLNKCEHLIRKLKS